MTSTWGTKQNKIKIITLGRWFQGNSRWIVTKHQINREVKSNKYLSYFYVFHGLTAQVNTNKTKYISKAIPLPDKSHNSKCWKQYNDARLIEK